MRLQLAAYSQAGDVDEAMQIVGKAAPADANLEVLRRVQLLFFAYCRLSQIALRLRDTESPSRLNLVRHLTASRVVELHRLVGITEEVGCDVLYIHSRADERRATATPCRCGREYSRHAKAITEVHEGH